MIGGGLLGIEAAYGLARAGVKVTLVHFMDRLMERQLDADAAQLLRAALETKGIDVCLAADTAAIHGTTHVESLELKDGRSIPCGLVVMAVGVRPNTALASASGLKVKRGIVVDDALTTSAAMVYAIGECAEHRGQPTASSSRLYEQARVLANVLTGTRRRLPRLPACDEPQGVRCAGVLGRRFRGTRGPSRSSSAIECAILSQAGGARRTARRSRARWRYHGRALVSRPHPIRRGNHRASPDARIRPGLCGGRVMSLQEFTDEQKRYLEGFVSGVQAAAPRPA